MGKHLALLLTDVVDSTALTAQLGDAAMSRLWTEHDRVSRDLLLRWHGQEIDRSDGFLLLFDHANEAVGFAVEYQRALTKLGTPLRARAGIHMGTVLTRENSVDDIERGAKPTEVDGLAKPIAARVMSLALGGQILLTAAARAALGPTEWRVLSHGHWRAKGLDEPIELFEVGDADAPFQPPPDSSKVYQVVRSGDVWLPVRDLPRKLPAERTPFIGRHAMLQELAKRLVGGARLVSVLGTAGMGKTRLVQRFAWASLGDFPGGVWFCDLSQATGLDGIVHSVAQGLDLPLGGADPTNQIGHAIAGRGHCLVILDNFEQVVRYAEETVGHWLDLARSAKFIVTTREVLGIAGEETLALPPLLPVESAKLFNQRAQATRLGFAPNAEDLEAIDQLVRLLDNLPLAIELAAARTPVMPPRLLLQRMSERFKLLASHGARPGRQTTLRAAFDGSWDLLSSPDKIALAQLSVFEAGFEISGAEAVIDLSGLAHAPWTLDVVQSLVNKSLVRQVSDHRFALLRSVQEYAAEHLRTEGRFPGSGEAARGTVEARHWRYFAALEERVAIAESCVEIDNLVAACRRAAIGGDASSSVANLVGAWSVLRLRGPFRGAIDLTVTVSEIPGLDLSGQATVEWVAGSALFLMGQTVEARLRLNNGLRLAREAREGHIESRLLLLLSELLSAESRMEESRASLQKALVLARSANDRKLQCNALNLLGAWFDDQSMLDDAQSHYEAGLALSRELQDKRMEGGLLGNLGGVYLGRGRLDLARQCYLQALQLAQQVGDRRWEGNAQCNLGLLDFEQGRSLEARQRFEGALAIAREMGHARLEATAQCNLGLVLEAAGEQHAACNCYERAVQLARELGMRRSEAQFRIYLGTLYARQGRLQASAECLTTVEMLVETLSDPVTLALLRCSQAELSHRLGQAAQAAQRLASARGLALEIGAAPASELGRLLVQIEVLLDAPPGSASTAH